MGKSRTGLLEYISKVIVDRRNLIFLFYTIAIIFSLFSMTWVEVENDIIHYLSKDSKTRQGLDIMEREFTTFGTANIMISNISLGHARELVGEIEKIPGVATVIFEDTEKHYKDTSALIVATFKGEDFDDISLGAMDTIEDMLEPYDSYISTTVGLDEAAQLTKDMFIIGVLASIVVFIVLLFTTKSYAEIPILLAIFGVAALLNLGTHFILGTISFVSNSVAVVLQLALAIDYAIILSHRFSEERENLPAREAAITALSKAIPEISSSSLTTIAGLAALAFMKFGIGKDLAAVMIKAILLSLLSVFTLMPGLLVMFNRLITKTQHKSSILSVSKIGQFSIKTRYIMPPIFVILLVVSFVFSGRCPFLFGMGDIRAHRVSEVEFAKDRIRDTFGSDNMAALIVPSGDYKAEKQLLHTLEGYDEIGSAMGLANTEAMGGYMLTDALTPRQFSELVDLDYEIAQLLYSAYAVDDEDYAKVVSGISQYGVPLIDMFQFLHDTVAQGYVALDDDLMKTLEDSNEQLSYARNQLQGENYSRLLILLNLPEESQETFDFISTIYREVGKYYDKDSSYIIGGTTNALDLSLTFDKDNLIISFLSVLFVIIILAFTFQSAGLPIILISVIQASIWINFSFPYIRGQGVYFLGYLLVTSIQMGANIDYAIIITSRFMKLKNEMPLHLAVTEALNQGFPTVITSGTILAIAGILIGWISTDGATAIMGSYLGQGTIISMVLVVFVLPQLLYLGSTIIERTSFRLKTVKPAYESKGKVYIDGKLRGYIEGKIDANVDGTIDGQVYGMLNTRKQGEEIPGGKEGGTLNHEEE